MASLGMTLAQSWALPGPEMDAIRAKYGNEYSEASYRQMTRETVFGYDYSWLASESDVTFVKNENFDGWKDVCKLVGFAPEEALDSAKVAAV